MDLQHENSVILRFKKVVSFFLDGIPRPFFLISSNVEHGVTFDFYSFGFLPDYTGQTKLIHFPEFSEGCCFNALCLLQYGSSTPSSRIGSHYSPCVGTFWFGAKGIRSRTISSGSGRRVVRVPTETCEHIGGMSSKAERELRTSLLVDLYEKIIEEHITHDKEGLRRIVVLGTQGVSVNCRETVERVVAEIKKVYVKACSYAMYRYMTHNLLFRRIVSSLCLSIPEDDKATSCTKIGASEDGRFERRLPFNESFFALKDSLHWGKKTHHFFRGLQELWMDRFDKLVLFDTTTTWWRTAADVFLAQLASSMRAAFTRIRVEFYSRIEVLLFDSFPRFKNHTLMNVEAMNECGLGRIFLVIRVFLVNSIRTLIFEALKDLVRFFTATGDSVISFAKARKKSLLEIFLTVGDSGLPRSPSFALLRFGLADLLDELLETCNNLPTPEAVIMRTLDFERRTLNSFDAEELCLRGVLLKCLDTAGSVIENLTRKYADFSTLPLLNGIYFTRVHASVIQAKVCMLRESIGKISKVSSDIVFCGCIVINCTEVKKWYIEQWSRYMENYLTAVRNDFASYVTASVEKCRHYNDHLSKEPKTVEELEEYNCVMKKAELLSNELKESNCNQVLEWFECLELLRIPVDTALCVAALNLMRCPSELMDLVAKAEEICIKNKPFIIEKLREFCGDTRDKVETIKDGVSELLGFFNLELSDIAAQTCMELRVIVDQVLKAIDHISYCEKSLQIEQVSSFEGFFSALRTFEVLEQFWGAIFDSTVVRDYYSNPINTLLAGKVIDNVQRCRRLLHSATRNLRAYPGLVRLGRQQEQVLCDFEALEGLLTCLTTPGLRKNHWKEIARLVKSRPGIDVQIDSNTTLRSLLDFGIHTRLDELRQVVDPAIFDFNTEAALEKMKSETKRTRFAFKLIEGTKDAFALSPSCKDSIFLQLESFLTDLRVLRQHASLSQYVVNSIKEWEAAVEKMRATLLNWSEIEREWIEFLYFGMTLEAMDEGDIVAVGSREWKFLSEKVGSVNGIFSVLSTTLQKPQYTLFSAMVQEDIQEQLTVAYTILSDIRKVITGLHDAKRELFPRFYFLSDGELISFLSVLSTTSLTRLLPKMYSRVCNVSVESNLITGFITADGAILKAKDLIPLSPIPVERWMKTFERTLRSSFLQVLCASVESHSHVDPMTWMRDSCVQLIDVALRIIYNRDLRAAISVGSNMGIKAYSKRLRDLMREYVRLAGGSIGSGERQALLSAITFILFARREVELILKLGVQTTEDLDKTAMLQTCMENNEVFVQTLSFRLPYGLEFLGNYTVPLLTPECVEKGLYSAFLSFAASSFPILVAESEKTFALEHCAQYLGRFWWCLQCYSGLTLDRIVQGLRGALSVGAVFCLKDIDLLDMSLVLPITKLFQGIEATCQSERRMQGSDVTRIDFETSDATISARKDPSFQVVFSTRNYDKIPTCFFLAFRPIYLPPVDLTLLAQGTLQALGVSQYIMVGQRLAAMYEQLIEVSPNIFTIRGFLSVVYNAVDNGSEIFTEKICTSFLRQFWQAVQDSECLQRLVVWNLVHTLGVSQGFLEDAVNSMTIGSGFDAIVDRFTCFMTFNTNVVLVGPAYSGKTRLWKSWVGSLPYVVISFRLMNCAEIYGSASQPGLLSLLAKQMDPLVGQIIVLEHVNFLEASILADTPTFVRIRPQLGPDFVKGPTMRLLAVKSELNTSNPRVATEFAVFFVPRPTEWKTFLRELLHIAPSCHSEVAYSVMVALIDSILDPSRTSRQIGVAYENPFAVASRCSQFYKRWYAYAQSWSTDNDEWIGEKAFALQCAVFATCWSLGLNLHGNERYVLRMALEEAQVKLNMVAKDIGFTEDVLPPLEDDILLYLATPTGWKKMNGEEPLAAEDAGFASMWTQKWTKLDTQQRAWVQFFPFSSREPTLKALELLISAGQSVLLVGGHGQGKSTLLQNMQSNDRWLREIVYNNNGCKAVEIQELLMQKLTLRQSKVYGPSLGQRLILCVDDVNIPGERGFSQVMHLFSFINRFSAICLPSIGYVPITDVVCLGASRVASSYEVEVENAVVRVRLPDLEDSEIVGGAQNFFKAIQKTRQRVDMSREVCAFLAEAQAIALHFMSADLGGDQVDDDRSIDLLVEENEEEVLQKCGHRGSFGFGMANRVSLSYLHIFLKISDRALRFLAGLGDEHKALKNIFSSVFAFYAPMFANEERQRQFQTLLRQSAGRNMKNFFESEFFLPDVFNLGTLEEEHDGTDLPPCTLNQVRTWIQAYEVTAPFSEIPGERKMDSCPDLVVCPSPLERRKLQKRNVKTPTTNGMTPCVARAACPPQWMSSRILALHQYLRQEQTHIAFIGMYGDGICQILRVWGAAMRIPVAFFSDRYAGDDANAQFKTDLIDILRYTCRNDSRLVMFVPNSLLELAWPMGCLDAIVRSGDVTRLFSHEELLFLLYGRRGILRSSDSLTQVELLELQQRIRKRLSVVTHILSYKDMNRLGATIPLLSFTFPISLRTSDMVSELMAVLLQVEEEKSQSRRPSLFQESQNSQDSEVGCMVNTWCFASESLASRFVAHLFCNFSDVMKIDIHVDQLLEFGFQARRLFFFLRRLRLHCAQSKHITNLPGLIREKMDEYKENHEKATASKFQTERRIELLFSQSQELEKHVSRHQNDAERFSKEADSTEAFITQKEEFIQAQSGRVTAMLVSAATRLTSTKSSQIRQFGSLSSLTKGVLLVKAVCRLIGEELPSGKANEMWERGKAIMTGPKFISRLVTVRPNTLKYESFSQIHASLREARYSDVSVFAAAVADYVVAVMEATRVGEIVQEAHVQLSDKRLYYSYYRRKLEKSRHRSEEALKKATETFLEITRLKKECEDLDARMDDLSKRQDSLTFLADIVDRFSPFHSPDEATKRGVLAAKGEGAVIMVALHRVFFAMLPFERQNACLSQVRSMLSAWDIAAPADLHDPMISLLFPSLDDVADKSLLSICSTHERLCAGALLQRVFFHWPFFGGVRPAFERVIRQLLKLMCGDCIVTSALDRKFTESCLEAFQTGAGLLICDASISLIMTKLHSLFLFKPGLWDTQTQQSLPRVLLFGKDVEIKSSFYLVCVSSASVPYDTGSSAMSRLLNITNFSFSVDVTDYVHATLVSCPRMCQNVRGNDVRGASDEDEHVISVYGDVLRRVSALLCEDIDLLAGDREGKLKELDTLVGELNMYHVRVLRLESQLNHWQKRLRDSWKYLKESVLSVDRALRVIEVNVLGRSWESRKLEAFITSASELLRPYQSQISPCTFEGLPELHKEFYATVNFIDRVIQVFSCGWPCELRGMFAWYVLSTVANSSEILLRLRGELFSSSTFFLNDEQYRVLNSLLDRGDNVISEEFVRNLYLTSTDSLLKKIVNDTILSSSSKDDVEVSVSIEGGFPGGSQSLVYSFFAHWMGQNYTMCDLIASHLYGVFLFAIREKNDAGASDVDTLYDVIGNSSTSVHSFEELLRFSMNACLPLSLISTNVYNALRHYERFFKAEKLAYRFCSVSTINDMEELMKTMLECFHKGPVNQERGHCIMAMLIPPADASEEAMFIQALSAQLLLYYQYGVWDPLRGGGTSRSPVVFCCAMWGTSYGGNIFKNTTGKSRCVRVLEEWCIPLTLETSFSRFYLFSLLKDRTTFLSWRLENTKCLLGDDTSTARSGKVLKGALSRLASRTLPTVRMANIIELQVGLCSRQVMLRALWEIEDVFGAVPMLWQTTVNRDDLTLILRLMEMWLRANRSGEAGVQKPLSRRSSFRQSYGGSMFDALSQFVHRHEVVQLDNTFNKLAYGIYAARMTSARGRLTVSEMLRQRISLNATDDRHCSSLSATIEEAAKIGTSETAFLAELSQSGDDFLSLSGDEFSVAAYRQMLDDTFRGLLYGACASKRKVVFLNVLETTQGTKGTVEVANDGPVPSCDIIQLLFLWEKNHMERLIETLTKDDQIVLASRVRAAMMRLCSWVPGETLTVWLPALQHPRLLLHVFAARAVSRKADNFCRVEMVLVLLRRYNLLHDDIVLSGAALSKQLEKKLLLCTTWNTSNLVWLKDACAKEEDEDIVIAVRFQRSFTEDAAEALNVLLWEVVPSEKPSVSFPLENLDFENVTFVTMPQSDGASDQSEIRSACALPVLCAPAAAASLSERVRDWHTLFHMPLCVVMTDRDVARGKQGSSLRRSKSTPGNAVPPLASLLKSPEERSTCVLNNSLTFFVTIS